MATLSPLRPFHLHMPHEANTRPCRECARSAHVLRRTSYPQHKKHWLWETELWANEQLSEDKHPVGERPKTCSTLSFSTVPPQWGKTHPSPPPCCATTAPRTSKAQGRPAEPGEASRAPQRRRPGAPRVPRGRGAWPGGSTSAPSWAAGVGAGSRGAHGGLTALGRQGGGLLELGGHRGRFPCFLGAFAAPFPASKRRPS
jgi:hypothetical protein